GHVEQEVRLDHLEPFVHHGRRVDGDLGPHLPARMRQGLGDGDRAEGLEWPAQEGATGPGQDQPPDGSLLFPPQALPDGTVLTVDRKDLRTLAPHSLPDQLARHHHHPPPPHPHPLPPPQRPYPPPQPRTPAPRHPHH